MWIIIKTTSLLMMKVEQISFKEQYILISLTRYEPIKKITKIFFKDLQNYDDLAKNEQLAKLISIVNQ